LYWAENLLSIKAPLELSCEFVAAEAKARVGQVAVVGAWLLGYNSRSIKDDSIERSVQ